MSEANGFSAFSLPEPLSKALARLEFQNPTPIQSQTIPRALENRDIVALAETGSGKTAAFLIPAIVKTLAQPQETFKQKQILILTPTRELAMQVTENARSLTHFLPDISSALLIGGAPMDRQIKSLRRQPRFIVATPGRLMDHVRRKSADLRNIEMLILDEADRMFDMGFAPQVNEIVRHIPKERQTMLFSATFPKEVRELAQKVLVNPIDIAIQKKILPPAKIIQKAVEIEPDQKNDKTLDLINAAQGSVLIFARTKSRTDRLARYLDEYGVKVARIHGDRTQGQRNSAIQGFKSGEYRVLVATDIAARGIDVSSVSDVINYDLPMTTEDYVHRIGRTGRAGREGQALTLVTTHDRKMWADIAKKMGLAIADQGDRRGSFGGNKKHSGKPQNKNHGRNNFGGKNRHEDARGGHGQSFRKNNEERGQERSQGPSFRKNNEERGNFGGYKPKFGRPKKKFGNKRHNGGGRRNENQARNDW